MPSSTGQRVIRNNNCTMQRCREQHLKNPPAGCSSSLDFEKSAPGPSARADDQAEEDGNPGVRPNVDQHAAPEQRRVPQQESKKVPLDNACRDPLSA